MLGNQKVKWEFLVLKITLNGYMSRLFPLHMLFKFLIKFCLSLCTFLSVPDKGKWDHLIVWVQWWNECTLIITLLCKCSFVELWAFLLGTDVAWCFGKELLVSDINKTFLVKRQRPPLWQTIVWFYTVSAARMAMRVRCKEGQWGQEEEDRCS